MIRAGAVGIGKITAQRGKTVSLLAGGRSLTLEIPDDTGLDMYSAVASSASALIGTRTSDAFDRFINHVTDSDAAKVRNDASRECLESFTSSFTDDLFTAIDSEDTARSILQFTWKCVPSIGKAEIEASGPLVWGASVILSAIAFTVSAVLTALDLIITGISRSMGLTCLLRRQEQPDLCHSFTTRHRASGLHGNDSVQTSPIQGSPDCSWPPWPAAGRDVWRGCGCDGPDSTVQGRDVRHTI
jgi:hypothetical protein